MNPFARPAKYFCSPLRTVALLLSSIASLGLFGCGDSSPGTAEVVPRNPGQAASQLEQVFASAPTEVKQSAEAAAVALRQADYEKAVVALQILRSRPGVTLDQGVAIHHSVVAMEAKLVSGVESGDPNAMRAYELLKALKRK